MELIVFGPAFIATLLPLFYGAAKARFLQGLLWTIGSLAVSLGMVVVGVAAIAGGALSGSANGLAAGLFGWVVAGLAGFVLSLVTPAYGIAKIAKACKAEELAAAARARRSRKKVSGRLGKASGGRPAQREEPAEERVPCPECAEAILPAAKTCRYCGSDAIRYVDHTRTTSSGRIPVSKAPAKRRRRR